MQTGKPPRYHSSPLIYCECGCGAIFPLDLMIARPTGNPDMPTEHIFKLHYYQLNVLSLGEAHDRQTGRPVVRHTVQSVLPVAQASYFSWRRYLRAALLTRGANYLC